VRVQLRTSGDGRRIFFLEISLKRFVARSVGSRRHAGNRPSVRSSTLDGCRIEASAERLVTRREPTVRQEVGPLDRIGGHDGRTGAELLPRQIDAGVLDPIPVVDGARAGSFVHQTAHQSSPELILHDERRGAALTAGGVPGVPVVDPGRLPVPERGQSVREPSKIAGKET